MTKEELKERCYDILANNFGNQEKLDKCIDKIAESGCIDLDKCPQNYLPAYNVVAALLEHIAEQCVYGSVDHKRRLWARRETNNIKHFIPTWWG